MTKVLQLCNKPPFPPVDGGMAAMNNITQGLLAAGVEVRVLSVCSDKHPVRHGEMTEAYMKATRFEAVHLDLGIHWLDAAVALLCGESYNVKRFESRDFERHLIAILQEETFDVVEIESVFMAPYLAAIRAHSAARVVLNAPNVEHEIWRGAAKQCKNPLKRWYLKHLALSLGAYEREMGPRADGVVCLTERDADFFRQQGCRHVLVRPFGITMQPFAPQAAVQPYTLFHIGSMDWQANVESIRWFLSAVWPRVHAAMPQVRLYLAGRSMPQELLQTHIEGVSVVGEVPDAYQFLCDKQINIVPLLFGSGIRVKIIEAMAAGKTVVSTRVGAAGIDYTADENLLLADSAEDFVRQIVRCVHDQAFCRQVGLHARRLVEERYDNDKLTQRLLSFYDTLHAKTVASPQGRSGEPQG